MRVELKAEIAVTNERVGVVETVVRDLAFQLMVGYVQNVHGSAIEELRERRSAERLLALEARDLGGLGRGQEVNQAAARFAR